ncbi:MAG: glutamate-5-semialdehyde dehydrogenase [Treponema sp.]|nr:glutamate-5-semialdehyde dehydrogenase [Treponema sp.]
MVSLQDLFISLKQSQNKLALENAAAKNRALAAVASALYRDRLGILIANTHDVDKARSNGMKESLVDRLVLNEQRINNMVEEIKIIIQQEDPVGKVFAGWTLPNGLLVEQIAVPLGTAAIIYESRPNVTVDCATLAYKSGCAILLRGSSAAIESNRALVKSIKSGLKEGGGIPDAVALCEPAENHADIDEILTARGWIDVVLPRGGKDLISRVVENARIPVIETGKGNCHIYVEPNIDMSAAIEIIANAKLQKPGACNAVETLLVHRGALAAVMPLLAVKMAGKAELRCDSESKAAIGRAAEGEIVIRDAVEEDWETEFLDYILAVKTVDSCNDAIAHINRYGTKHSDTILTNDLNSAKQFRAGVDSACVYVNASTRFTDGGEFGFGAELGISTQKFHVRGPMGLEALTTYKYLISGSGQVRS